MTPPISEDVPSSEGASADTVTVSETLPAVSAKFVLLVVPISTWMPVWCCVLKLGAATVTVYEPTRTWGKLKLPCCEDFAVYVVFVAVSTAVTVAPGMRAPEVSDTVPESVPRFDWADRSEGDSRHAI